MLAGGAGNDIVKGGVGNDVLIYAIGENAGAFDRYIGSKGEDVLRICGTAEELADPDLLADIAALEIFLAENADPGIDGGPTYEFDSIGLDVRSIEAVELVLIEDAIF